MRHRRSSTSALRGAVALLLAVIQLKLPKQTGSVLARLAEQTSSRILGDHESRLALHARMRCNGAAMARGRRESAAGWQRLSLAR